MAVLSQLASSCGYSGEVNGITIPDTQLMIDPTNKTKDVVHFMLPKEKLVSLAEQVNNISEPSAVMKFALKPVDLLGYSLNVAAKITSHTPPNKISVGDIVYKLLHPELQAEFYEQVNLNLSGWKYINHKTGEIYKVYTP
jgi:adenylate cyclase